MVYTIAQADAVSTQLAKFSTAYAHHVVGQFANLEFWLAEAIHALEVIDDYPHRFSLMRDAQVEWIEAHGTLVSEYCPHCRGKCEFEAEGGKKPQPPTRIDSKELEAARRRLKDSTYHFALRCYRLGLLDESGLRAACARVGTGVDAADLRR